MSGKAIPFADGMNWLPLSRELIESDAWRSMTVNVWRLISFLMREHLSHGGKENGKLKATHRQLQGDGIGARHVAGAIRSAEELGLIRCQRAGLRIMTTFSLTWLPLHDRTAPTDEWRSYQNPSLMPLKNRNLTHKGKAELPHKGKADRPKRVQSASQREGRSAKNLPSQGMVPSRSSYQGGGAYSNGRERERAPPCAPSALDCGDEPHIWNTENSRGST